MHPVAVGVAAGVGLCFHQGSLQTSTWDLSLFGDGASVYVDELRRYLDHAGVLHALPNDSMLTVSSSSYGGSGSGSGSGSGLRRRLILGEEGDDDGDDEEDDEGEGEGEGGSGSYCGDPSCGRTFPHEHVVGAGGTLTGAADDKGSEALPDNVFYRV